MHEIIDAMVRTLWVCAWADAMEEADRSGELSQCDLMDIAPEIPDCYRDEFRDICAALYGQVRQVAGCDPWLCLFHWSEGDPGVYQEWGHYAIMEALGTGVAWADDYEPVVYQSPSGAWELPSVGDVAYIEAPPIDLAHVD